MTPIGYTRKNTGTFLAIAICVGASVLISMFVSNGAKFSDVKYLGIMAAILALFCILSDITSNISCLQVFSFQFIDKIYI